MSEPDELLLVDVETSAVITRDVLPSTWSTTLMDDYSRKGQGLNDTAERANQAAEGAYTAQSAAAANETDIIILQGQIRVLQVQVLQLISAAT
jgi:hypothetical protein